MSDELIGILIVGCLVIFNIVIVLFMMGAHRGD